MDVDENMGRVMNHLRKTNQLDDTVVMQTSDHGFFLGEWRMYDKRLMYEPSIKVPMMIRYPKLFKAGKKGEPDGTESRHRSDAAGAGGRACPDPRCRDAAW